MKMAKEGKLDPIIAKKALIVGKQMGATFKKAYAQGVPIAYGTDAGVFDHSQNNIEFLL